MLFRINEAKLQWLFKMSSQGGLGHVLYRVVYISHTGSQLHCASDGQRGGADWVLTILEAQLYPSELGKGLNRQLGVLFSA